MVAFAAAVMVMGAGEASAHRLKVFAMAVGQAIEGKAYFVGGGPAADIAVTLRDESDAVLETARTGPDGRFALPAPDGISSVVVADAGDGHVARFAVAGTEGPKPPRVEEASPARRPPPVDTPSLEAAIARQIAPLAAEIDALESSIRLRDIVGGVGWIIGIFGVLALLKSRRRTDRKGSDG